MSDQVNEIWRPVQGFPGYLISDFGRVKSLRYGREKILKPALCHGYLFVCLCRNGKAIKGYIHRLVSDEFISNPDQKPRVDHINTDRSDNRSVNLRWVTPSENNLNEISRKRISESKSGGSNPNFGRTGVKHPMYGRKFKDNPRSIPIVCIELNQKFSSAVEAEAILGIKKTNIRRVLAGKGHTAGGYHWKLAEVL